jgi:predicted glycoside hydrolase/deacetylase ChbG (UPF0249 family)
MLKYLIVNGDDFGASPGINRGIVEAHRRGVLTSASLLVDRPWSEQAARLSRSLPGLSVGLHLDVRHPDPSPATVDPGRLREELERQFSRFQELAGCAPTHLDSHHNLHRSAEALPCFLDLARRHRLPLREHSAVRYFGSFYAQWDGETHLEQVGVESLSRMLETEIGEGITELACHPGFLDPDPATSYAVEREAELRTLCDPRIRQVLREQAIHLISYRHLGPLGAGEPASDGPCPAW